VQETGKDALHWEIIDETSNLVKNTPVPGARNDDEEIDGIIAFIFYIVSWITCVVKRYYLL